MRGERAVGALVEQQRRLPVAFLEVQDAADHDVVVAGVVELRAAQYRAAGLVPARTGFYGARPPRPLIDAARDFYGTSGTLS